MSCLSFTTTKRSGTECQGLRLESITRDGHAVRKPVLVAYDSSIDTFRFTATSGPSARSRLLREGVAAPGKPEGGRFPRLTMNFVRYARTAAIARRSFFRARRALRDTTNASFFTRQSTPSPRVSLDDGFPRFFGFRGISSIIMLDAKIRVATRGIRVHARSIGKLDSPARSRDALKLITGKQSKLNY